MSIVYIKSSEDLYHCYKYKPIIISNVVDVNYIDNLNRSGPIFNEDTNNLEYNCYLIRKYKGTIKQYKSNNIILVVDDKLAKPILGYNSYSHIVNNKLDLFDSASYNYFVDLCKKWANPYKWEEELLFLESLEEVITVKLLNILYVNNRVDVWEYINNIGKGKSNYGLILSLDPSNLWYLFMIKNVINSVRNINPQVISYFELLKVKVIEGKLSLKFALIYLEIYAQTREQLND